MTYPLPTAPWQVVASDCFELDERHYCVYVDVYSDYIDFCELEDMTSKDLIAKTKPIFATHGVPAVLITDNGTNYASREFTEFARAWDFQHQTSSPHYSQSNGKAESAVKIIKGLIQKTVKSGGDIWKAVLEWRNSPTPNMINSPVQRLMSRRTRSFLPCKDEHYQPCVQESVPKQVIQKRLKAKQNYDRGARPLPKLVVGQPIRAKTQPKVPHSTWKAGIVTSQVAPRSYLIEVDGRTYRRNRVHLRDTIEHPPPAVSSATPPASKPLTFDSTACTDNRPSTSTGSSSTSSPSPQPRSSPSPKSTSPASPRSTPSPASGAKPKPVTTVTPGHTTTRVGRVSKPPPKLQDFVK